MKQTRHRPGDKNRREFSNYTSFSEALWVALDDFYYADVGGYSAMRMPTPGKSLEPTHSYNLEFKEWQKLVIDRWKAESNRDHGTRGCTIEAFPENLWYYLYERFMDATDKYYKPKKIPGTPLPRDFGGC